MARGRGERDGRVAPRRGDGGAERERQQKPSSFAVLARPNERAGHEKANHLAY
jgi:hypothetical protein